MVQIRKGIRPEEVRRDAEHVLFVEGSEEGLDQVVLRPLLGNTLRIEVMGPSYSVRSAAQALAKHHPRYYFLIDRDHYDELVEKSWQDFPDPAKDNLLVWRRREIENYFLDPPFLMESKFRRTSTSEEKLKTTLVRAAQKRLFLDVANSVISSIREEQKFTWIQHFTNPVDFPSRSAAIEQLISKEAFVERGRKVSEMLSKDALENWLEESLASMTGGGETLTYGRGQWVAMIRGKRVLPQLLNSGGFQVKDATGQTLQGDEIVKEIVKELIVKEVASRPSDLVRLKQLIQKRVASQ